jgi:hypothetical protein
VVEPGRQPVTGVIVHGAQLSGGAERIEGHDVDGECLAADRMRDGLVLDAEAGREDDLAKREITYGGNTPREIDTEASICRLHQFAGSRSLDSRFCSGRESATDSFLKDFGGVQFLPPSWRTGTIRKGTGRIESTTEMGSSWHGIVWRTETDEFANALEGVPWSKDDPAVDVWAPSVGGKHHHESHAIRIQAGRGVRASVGWLQGLATTEEPSANAKTARSGK